MDENMEDVDNSRESLSSECSSDTDETLGDPEIQPRVGDNFQVEVPELMMEYDVLQYIRKLNDSPNMGLFVPVMWVDGKGETIDSEALKVHGNRDSATYVYGSVETESSEDSQITSNDEDTQLKVEPLGIDSKYSKETQRKLSKLQPGVDGGRMDGDFSSSLKMGTSFEHGKRHGCFLPASATDTLNDIEYDSSLLGLYIFGKNLYLVNKFVGSRKMEDILSNYYGKFYRSTEYRRWAQSRKIKARRCVQGQRMFTGWRLNELLSRILPHMSEESKSSLIEVSKRFVEGKVPLEDYVFTLKDMVGLGMLVEAVAIGKGKQDLTGTAIDPSKTRQVLPVRPEIPSGKACSSLTKGEIVKYLTGDFRLSKAKAADLFWEAVWPRLLARGWHSEQPRDYIHSALNNSLVFLVPGVNKFSRRKLTKGDHYFDSFTDVLNKVAAEPVHLELESDSEQVFVDKEECGSGPDVSLKKQRSTYLQPVKSKFKKDTSFCFTIVDTSYFCAGKRPRIRELKKLPVDTVSMSARSSLSSEPERDNAKENENETEVNKTSNRTEDIVDSRALTDSARSVISKAPDHVPSNPDARNTSLGNQDNQRTSIPSNSHSSKTVKFQFSRKRKSQKSSNVEPVKEVTVGKHDALKYTAQAICEDTKPNGTDSRPLSSSFDRFEVKKNSSGAFQDISSDRPMVCNAEDSGKEAALNTCLYKEPSPENSQSETLIDVNVPHVLPVSGTNGSVHTNSSSTARPSLLSQTSDQPEFSNPCNSGTETEQQPVITGRRQSTRNRPLTTKALEAFAFEFDNPKKKKKGVDTMY